MPDHHAAGRTRITPSTEHAPAHRELSSAGKACAAWFRQLARALRTCRLYRPENPLVQSVRENTVDALLQQLRNHGGWTLRFTPGELLLGEERIVSAPAKDASEAAATSPETRLPFMFYRDGIRSMRIADTLSRGEAYELFDALVLGCNEKTQTDDLVTLLWQANLSAVMVDSAPLEQTFYLSDRNRAPEARGTTAARFDSGVSGTEVRAQLGQAAGGQGLHLDTFDDWPLAPKCVDVVEAFEVLQMEAGDGRLEALSEWAREKDGDWDADVPALFRQILAMDRTEDTRTALAGATATWVTGMIEQHHLQRSGRALALLDELDLGYERSTEVLQRGLEHVDAAELSDYLDEAEPSEHGRFAALMVHIGEAAVPLTYEVMGRALRSRVRAAAATALCYQCAERPDLLERFVNEPRPDTLLHLVFVLGQIGGAGVLEMLRGAAQHSDPRVRRQAVLSLGGVPESERTPALLDELARLDPHILSTTLGLLARHRDENVTRFILSLIQDPEFESRGEDVQRAMFGALGDVADDSVVQALAKLLHRGPGWLARRTFLQFAAALTLRRLGTPAALAALQAGLKSRNAAVRSACQDAMKSRTP